MLNQQSLQVWELKPNTPLIYNSVSVLQLLTNYQKPEISTLNLLQDQYPLYTPCTEDGNSFYRSVAFDYILSFDNWSFETIFSQYNEIDFTLIDISTIPREFQQVYSQQQLKESLKNGWKTFIEQSYIGNSLSSQGLLQVLNQRWFLDFLIILYFRGLNYLSIVQKSRAYSVYSSTIELEKNIKSYKATPIHQQIKSLAKALKCEIYLVNVNEKHDLETSTLSSLNASYSLVKKLPILKFRGSYNSLYTVKQAKLLRNVLRSQYIPDYEINTYNQKSELKYQEKEHSFCESEKTLKHSTIKPKQTQNTISLQFNAEDEYEDQKLENFKSSFSTNRNSKLIVQKEEEIKYVPKQEKSWSYLQLLRLLLLIALGLSFILVFYRYKFPKTPKSTLRPARQVHFIKDKYGQYQSYY